MARRLLRNGMVGWRLIAFLLLQVLGLPILAPSKKIGPKRKFAKKNEDAWKDLREWPDWQWQERFGMPKAVILELHSMLEPYLSLRTKGPSREYRNCGRKVKWTTFHSVVLGILRLRSRLTWTEFRDYWAITRGGSLASCLISFRDSVNMFCSDFINFPCSNGGQLDILSREFAAGWGIPCCGVLDGLHIPFRSGDLDDTDRNGNCSLLLLAVVDANGLFRAAAIGFPGRMNDPGALRLCSLGRTVLPELRRLGYFILGDSIFPASGALVTPYDGSDVDARPREERLLQWALIRTRSVVERAFGCLLSKFPWLREMRLEEIRRAGADAAAGHEHAARWVLCAMILHNVERLRFASSNRERLRHGQAPLLDPLDTVQPAELVTRRVLSNGGYLNFSPSVLVGGPPEAEMIRQHLIDTNGWRQPRAGDAAF